MHPCQPATSPFGLGDGMRRSIWVQIATAAGAAEPENAADRHNGRTVRKTVRAEARVI